MRKKLCIDLFERLFINHPARTFLLEKKKQNQIKTHTPALLRFIRKTVQAQREQLYKSHPCSRSVLDVWAVQLKKLK